MKKLLSLFAAVLFAGSMMADAVLLTPADATSLETGATSGLDVTINGIQLTWEGAFYNNDNSADFRVYANKTMKLTASEGNITKVRIAGYAKAGLVVTVDNGTVTTGASYDAETTKDDFDDPLIVVEDINEESVTLTCTKQMRAMQIEVTVGEAAPVVLADGFYLVGSMNGWAAAKGYQFTKNNEAGTEEYVFKKTFAANDEFKVRSVVEGEEATWYPEGMGNNFVISEAGEYTVYFRPGYDGNDDWHERCIMAELKVVEVLTCAEAVEVAANNDGQEYIAQGYVTEIVTAYSSQYGNITFWMADEKDGGQVLQAFRCKPESADKLPEVGDKVEVTGKLKVYTKDDVSTPEFDANCTCKIIEKGEGGSGEEGDVLTCAEAVEIAANNDGQTYTAKGYVTEIVTEYSEQYGNISFWMADAKDGGHVLQAFRCKPESASKLPEVGDLVEVTGKLKVYTKDDVSTPEFDANCTCKIIEKGEGGGSGEEGDVLTCAEAVEIAANNDGQTYTAKGYVTEIVTEYSEQYGNISFWMADAKDGGHVLQAFRCKPESASKLPEVGDLVEVTGKLKIYTKDDVSTPEFDANCTCKIIEKGEGGGSGEEGDVLTCAEAVEIAANNDGQTYTAKGYVTEIVTEYSEQYGNISFWMADAKDGGHVLQAFRCKPESASKLPEVGDLVEVTGKLKVYTKDDVSTPEFDANCTCKIIEKGEGGGSGEQGDALTCAQAVEIAAASDGQSHTAVGYVTSIKSAYSAQYGNITFWMADTKDGGEVLQAFRCVPESADKLPEVGDKVRVTGTLTMYNSTPEFEAGCTCVIVEKGEGSDPLPTEIGEVTTCAEAAEALAGVQPDVQVNNGADFTLQGYVTEIATEYSEQYGNISFWMADEKDGGQVLQAWRCVPESADKLPEVGDFVEVTGKLKRHGSIAEFDANCTCKIIEKGEGGGEDEDHPYDEDADFNVIFPSYTIDDSGLEQYGSVYVEAFDEEGNYIVLDITLPEGAEGLVAGTYAVDDSYEYPVQTVTAGIYYEDNLYPSYAAVIEGEDIEKIWWIVDGQVEIDANLNITVDAVNSLGREVVAVLAGDNGDAVETTKVADAAVKSIKNAMLIIERNGVRYNVMGQVIR